MKVVASMSLTFAPPQTEPTVNPVQGGFQSALDSALSVRADGGSAVKSMTPEERARQMDEADAATRKAFSDYMKKSPMQRMREAILKEMHLTEEALNAMEPEQRDAYEAAIADRIKQRMGLKTEERGQLGE